jgi:hypothetical protein
MQLLPKIIGFSPLVSEQSLPCQTAVEKTALNMLQTVRLEEINKIK